MNNYLSIIIYIIVIVIIICHAFKRGAWKNLLLRTTSVKIVNLYCRIL